MKIRNDQRPQKLVSLFVHNFLPDMSCEPLEHITPISKQLPDNQLVKVNDNISEHHKFKRLNGRLSDRKWHNRKQPRKLLTIDTHKKPGKMMHLIVTSYCLH